jgi:hypothetical protein
MNNDMFNNPIMFIFLPLYGIIYAVVFIVFLVAELITGKEIIERYRSM